jgi:hypothetical protein
MIGKMTGAQYAFSFLAIIVEKMTAFGHLPGTEHDQDVVPHFLGDRCYLCFADVVDCYCWPQTEKAQLFEAPLNESSLSDCSVVRSVRCWPPSKRNLEEATLPAEAHAVQSQR